jgi:glutamate-1-semialdehyde 2,1-aminomutase
MNALVMSGTFSKSPLLYGLPESLTVTRAYGSTLELSDGRVVTCWVNGLGAHLFGYDPLDLRHHLDKIPFCAPSLPHYLEHQVADKLALLLGNNVPGWIPEGLGVRFCKTGSEATTMAVRLARAVTGREMVLTFEGQYHGWGAEFIARTEPAWGLRFSDDKDEREFVYGIYETTWMDKKGAFEWGKNITGQIAAVIFEQPATDPAPSWYPFLRQWCNDNGALLIADETVTGLRYGLGGACGRYGIEPDLVCMGKALGNGLAINSLTGRREYMEWFSRVDPVFASSTFWGETSGLAAADWVLDNWSQEKVDYIWGTGIRLKDGLEACGWSVMGHGARSVLQFESDVERAFFIHGMLDRAILMNRPNFPTTVHDQGDVIKVIDSAYEVRAAWYKAGPEEAAVQMTGKIPRVLFKNR